MIFRHGSRRLLILVVAQVITACASIAPNDERHGVLRSPAYIPEPSATNRTLTELPTPKGKIVAAVYGFSDLTGQNKTSPSSHLSTAVTQGASTLLMKALLQSGWFQPVERNNLQNLLTERNLWAQKLSGKKLPPLPPASVILEGGIVAYDFNVRTGGAGAKYLGIGGSKTYREDTVTVNIRVVNANDGSILHSINSSKSVYSETINTGAFGFVSFDELLELESGYAFNEPILRSVEESIEIAVIALIAEGIVADTWKLSSPDEINDPVFDQFMRGDDRESYLNRVLLSQDGAKQKSSSSENVVSAVTDGAVTETANISTGSTKDTIADREQVEAPVVETYGGPEVRLVSLTPAQDATERRGREQRLIEAKHNLVKLKEEEKLYQERVARIRAEKNKAIVQASVQSDGQETNAALEGSSQDDSNIIAEKIQQGSPVAKEVFLLIGDYKVVDQAEKSVEEIKSVVTKFGVGVGSDNGNESYRVFVGPMTKQEEVDVVVEQLRPLELGNIKLVQK